ncbi:VWA domain-containing protein [Pseudonocardia bannensis]|uniref:VWA domain-containing protein n=1 Tax=Pseudonocardia bannensis TaxID=630973 RepID=A0A848DPY6_9PSEU|nr:VWA domain-containing protein [Pseudonocardia bannensis]NMH94897.1 VWA domain-containing protein [Pseudonocardia bannensis]
MEASIHRFVRLLRLRGVRISVSEAVDAMHCAGQPGILADREVLREALRVALIKDRRDDPTYDEVFSAFFALVKVGGEEYGHGHGHGHGDMSDEGTLEDFTLSEEPSETPQQGHSHGKPVDIRDFFDPEDLAQQYNLHQEANKIDLAAMTEEIVFSKDNTVSQASEGNRVQIETDRLSGAGLPGDISTAAGTKVDADLSVAQQEALLGWLTAAEDEVAKEAGTEDDAAALRRRLTGVLANLPEAIKEHLERLLELEQRIVDGGHEDAQRVAEVDRAGESERMQLEDSLRRLAKTLHGALTHRRRVSPQGRVDSGRTMRRNMRYDGIPFNPVTVRRAEDKPRLVVLADVSLSVRATARFTLHLVHGLQDLFGQVRSFAFVSDLVEITDLFADHPVEKALGLVFGGDLLDVDANSHYGLAFGQFLDEHGSAVTRRSTVLVLGDGRGNGNDPNMEAFIEITRRARETIWLTPEPRYSWGLGRCDLPAYAEYCDRVRVVRDLTGLEATTNEMAGELIGR